MAYRFNSPPNWPQPSSADWVPPKGWAPDPSWGPPPAGWNFWTETPSAPHLPPYVSAAVTQEGDLSSRYPVAPRLASRPLSAEARRVGWALAGAGGLIFVAALLPWATLGPFSVAGTSGDGVMTLFFGLIAAGAGLARGLANTSSSWQVAIPVLCIALGVLTALVGIVDIGNASDSPAAPGIGRWLTLIGGLGLIAASIVGVVKRV